MTPALGCLVSDCRYNSGSQSYEKRDARMKAHQLIIRTLFFFSAMAVSTRLAAEAKFERQTIDGEIQIGYGLSLGRVDADEKIDVLLADKKEIVWYQNPGKPGEPWPKHVIARNLTAKDNVCLAARDITGDGLVEIAVGANWNPGNTTEADVSGTSFYLQRPSDPTKPWTPIPLTPHEPTTHRMHWLKNGDGEMRLVVLPLHGVGNQKGHGKSVQVSVFEIDDNKPKLVEKVDTEMHATHNFELTQDDAFGPQEFMLIAGAEGYLAASSTGETIQLVDDSESKGAGEVRRYPAESRVFIGIEPMHGTDVAMYTNDGDEWSKEVLDQGLSQGHALAAGDLFGSSLPEVIAGWRGKDAQGKFGIKIYSRSKLDDEWTTTLLDDNQIACEDLKVADLDGDGKLDVIGAGRATKNVVIYWNQSP